MASEHKELTGQLAEYLKFIGDARSYIKQNKTYKHHPEVKAIRSEVEDDYQDDHGEPAIYQKFESALYEDAPALVSLWRFMRGYNDEQLCLFHKLTLIELDGLRGDYHPMAIFGRSVLGAGALVLSGMTVWSGLINLVSNEDAGNWFTELLHSFLSPSIENSLVGVVMLVGLFVVIWYPLRMVRNRKQVAFLSSLSRALTLYLDSRAQ
jgi:hypothetical protein